MISEACPSERVVVVCPEGTSVGVPSGFLGSVIQEPVDKGDANAVLLASLKVLQRDPSPLFIVVRPDVTNHHVLPDDLAAAIEQARETCDRVLRIGDGVLVASAAALLMLYRDRVPVVLARFLQCLSGEPWHSPPVVDHLFSTLSPTDLERDLLVPTPGGTIVSTLSA